MAVAALFGTWVQDETGPVITHRRRYHFKADGSYELLFTSRHTGSLAERVLTREVGTFTVEGDQLVIAPESCTLKAVSWRVERDRYVGNTQLVMEGRDGGLDVYYPE